MGFISVMKLESGGKIFPHENTHASPKEDRFKLLSSVGANLSPSLSAFPTGSAGWKRFCIHVS